MEILKASGWQFFGLSIALSAFWTVLFFEWLPPVENDWIVYGLPLAILVTFGLSVVAALEKFSKFVGETLKKRTLRKQAEEKEAKELIRFLNYIPHLTKPEWRILAYLYQNNQRTLVATIDGDAASTLYNQGFIRLAARPGQKVSVLTATFVIPDFVWDGMQMSNDLFEKPPVDLGYSGRMPWHTGL